MKTINLVIVLYVLSFSLLFGRIRNGYEPQLQSTKISLQKLNLLLLEDKDMSLAQRLRVKTKIENLINYISCYELTEEVIRQLKIVTPYIYIEIDCLKDRKGRPTDVYMKLIPKEKSRMQLKAASFFKQMPMDEDANLSEYGAYSVSIDIWIVDNALFLLSHELGHINYIVPNLATYSKFYEKHYPKSKVNISYIGHEPYDQSGKSANVFEKRFLQDKRIYFQNGGKKIDSLISLLNQIKRNTRNSEAVDPLTTLVSTHTF
jgi:hypothetical protein